jgi:hypothetical protein
MKKETNYFFNLSPCGFTQISIGSARWMGNSIPHPTSTHLAYFWLTPLHKKQEIHENVMLSKVYGPFVEKFMLGYVPFFLLGEVLYLYSNLKTWLETLAM